ncbi:MAG: glucose 1-dehydrogenase [Anaerolineae bacterium]|nr:glucose 1-dehydrogenase [Anaerolineae bacterium]
MTERFQNKVVIVTGAGKGMGRSCALAFAREGGAVTVADIDENAGQAVVHEITEVGGRALFVRCNVGKSTEVQRLIGETVSAFGGVDVVHNNAGIQKYGSVVDMPESEWDNLMDINLKATFLTSKYAIPEMRKRGGGAIVNTTSVQAFASQRSVAAYAASKGAMVSLTRCIALDHAPENIRCNCIAPGSIDTPMLRWAADVFVPENPSQAIVEWGSHHPLGRVGTSEEVARLVLFLASDDSSFCTGACYTIDGGLLAALM